METEMNVSSALQPLSQASAQDLPPLSDKQLQQFPAEQQQTLEGQRAQQFSQPSTSLEQDPKQTHTGHLQHQVVPQPDQLSVEQEQQLHQQQLLQHQQQLQQQLLYQQPVPLPQPSALNANTDMISQPMNNGVQQQQQQMYQQQALLQPMAQMCTQQQQHYVSQYANSSGSYIGTPSLNMNNPNNPHMMPPADQLPNNGGPTQPQVSQLVLQAGQGVPQQIMPTYGQGVPGRVMPTFNGSDVTPNCIQPVAPQNLQPSSHVPAANVATSTARIPVTKNWHDPAVNDTRIKMRNRIETVLRERRPQAPPDWLSKLPQMAKRLEEALYSNANTFEEYRDETTLKSRLQQYAMSVSNRNNQANRSLMSAHRGQIQQQNFGPGRSEQEQRIMGGYQQNTNNRPPGVGMTTNSPTVGRPQDPNQAVGQYYQQQQQQQQQVRMHQIQQNQVNVVSGNEVNEEDKLIVGNGSANQEGVVPNGPNKASNSSQQRSEEHRRQVLKQQQQRLLLLRHASKCPHENCTVTQHCAGMKELWKHVMSCKEHECKESHCVSSRYVLSHYSKCKEKECPVCGPVREAIRRNYEKSRAIVALSKVNNQGGGSRVVPEGEPKVGGKTKQQAEVGPDGKPVKRKKQTKKQKEQDQKLNAQQQQVPDHGSQKVVPKTDALDPVSCSIYGFSSQQIEAHIKGIHEGVRLNAAEIKNIMIPIVDGLLKHHSGYIFASPVDPVAYNLPDYFDIIKMPMDLGTVKKKLESSQYRDPHHVLQEISLTFDNAILYNPKENDIHKVAIQMKGIAERQFKAAMTVHHKKLEEARMEPSACSLCGETSMYFEPPVYYCQGKCGGQRIRRNAWYYCTSNNQNHWCSNCFNDMKPNQRIELPDMTITKEQLALSKKKHEHETPELSELWVCCDICNRWVHQICGLFNSRRNTSEDVAFVCPVCVLDRRAKIGNDLAISSRKMKASDLPHNSMSRFIETRVTERVQRAYDARAELLGKPKEEIEKCSGFFIRQVSCVDKNQQVREGVRERYKHKGYPTEFPCRTKCIILFQNIDGQDVVLFGMYVYEYGHKCPEPNRRRVYVSYLDSVHYFRPRHYRTVVYQEIIVSYLEYVKHRGFHTAHIWACPPLKGDDYILYCHPQDQKTPKDDRLRQWYVDTLKTCKERGIAVELTDLYTEFLADTNNDGTVLPYFEGDYWVNEAEVIIKELSKTAAGKLKLSEGNIEPPEENTATKKNKTKRTRSSKGELIIPGARNRDIVMSKLATIIQPMKEAFFVAKLHPQEYIDKYTKTQVSEEGAKSSDDKSDESALKRAKIEEESALNSDDAGIPTGAGTASEKMTSTTSSAGDNFCKEIKTEQEISAEAKEVLVNSEGSKDSGGGTIAADNGASCDKNAGNKTESSSDSTVMKDEKNGNDTTENASTDVSSDVVGQKPDAQSDVSKNVAKLDDTKVSGSSTDMSVKDADGKSEDTIREVNSKELFKFKNDNTDDIDETSEAEHTYFNTRQDVLQLCQGNHYQFDQLRRAKHTSMMILYHLHNPDAPKFVPSCTLCTKDILSGYRHHCETCEIDICHQCFTTKGAPSSLHPHPLRAVSVANGQPAQQLTEEQRKEREKSIQMHLHLLNHASSCNSQCKSKNCARMREFLRHGQTCKNGTKGGCPLCKKIYNLLTLHARSCKNDNCKVAKCNEIREQMRKMEQRQQAMDDRRRAMMNQTYGQHGSSA